MKLGIAVVYLVREDSEPLLQIHLARIRRHTSVPYVIHGAPLKLPARFQRHLDAPDARLHALTPPADVLAHVEHSFLLTELLNRAAEDGCSHLGTLHVDSFPVADGWAEATAQLLTPQAPVAAVIEEMEGDTMARPNLAGMMTTAAYWRTARPMLIPTPELETTQPWRQFLQRHQQHVTHGGVGLGYSLEQSGLTWTPLPRTNRRTRHPVLAGIYADRIFHLGAATRAKNFMSDAPSPSDGPAMALRRRLARTIRAWLPASARRALRPLRPLGRLYDTRPNAQNEAVFAEMRRELFADPDQFLAAARRDAPPPGASSPSGT